MSIGIEDFYNCLMCYFNVYKDIFSILSLLVISIRYWQNNCIFIMDSLAIRIVFGNNHCTLL